MNDKNRILIVGRQQGSIDTITRLLEGVGCIVTGTTSDGVAIDLARSSDYDALLIEGEVSHSDGRYVATEARSRKPSLPVIIVQNPESVMTQLRGAGVKL